MYGTPPKYRNPKLIPVSPELDAWLTGKEYIKAEPVPPLGSTVVIVGVTFKLAEAKSGELIWKATHGDLDLEFKSRVGESVEESSGDVRAVSRHGSPMVTDYTPVRPPSAVVLRFLPGLVSSRTSSVRRGFYPRACRL
jgi:hypothetical protein